MLNPNNGACSCSRFAATPAQIESLQVARAIVDYAKEYVNLEYALKEKQMAFTQNIVGGRDVVGILMTLKGGQHAQASTHAWYVFTC